MKTPKQESNTIISSPGKLSNEKLENKKEYSDKFQNHEYIPTTYSFKYKDYFRSSENVKIVDFLKNNEKIDYLLNYNNKVSEYSSNKIEEYLIDKTETSKKSKELEEGSFENGDVPLKLVDGKINTEGEILISVEWKNRPNGKKPINSILTNVELKELCPRLLIEFYESRIIKKV